MTAPDSSDLPKSAIGLRHGASTDESLSWLEAALRATPGGGDGADDASNEALLNNLLEIRRGQLDEGFELVPAGQMMVEAVLNARYGVRYGAQYGSHYGASSYGNMSLAIIESMGNDPVCRDRLESLWDRLGKAVGGNK